MGYQDVEFFAPYYDWTPAAGQRRPQADGRLGIKCLSTHNHLPNYKPENIQKTIDYNKMLGAQIRRHLQRRATARLWTPGRPLPTT